MLDAWTEWFNYEAWQAAFAAAGRDLAAEAAREWCPDWALPWDHLSAGVERDFYLREARRAEEGRATGDCHTGPCEGCGLARVVEACRTRWRRGDAEPT
jgi:hypothetical protein